MTLILAMLLLFVNPHTAYAATAIASCESGDTVTFGSYVWTARSYTADGGAWQFNDSTWDWIVGTGRGDTASPLVQTNAFVRLFNGGDGIAHWASSQGCWSKWLDASGNPIDRQHYNAFVEQYMYQGTSILIRNGAMQ